MSHLYRLSRCLVEAELLGMVDRLEVWGGGREMMQ